MKRRISMLLTRLVCLALLVGLCSCASRPPAPKAALSHAGVHTWEGRAFDRVVGYRFADSAEWRSVLRLDLKQVDLKHLQKMKRNEAVLSEAQIAHLMDAIFGKHHRAYRARCYNPHHIFLFYAKDRLVGAFELCLECSQHRAWPRTYLQVTESYGKLAALCQELGLGVKAPRR